MDSLFIGKSSAVQRHFAQFERHQLQQVNSEIELGWNCRICLQTAEDPCVTRCGHLHCRSHLNDWLSKNSLCPVCHAFCTPSQDIVPLFLRDPQPSPLVESSLTSACSSPAHESRPSSSEPSLEPPVTDVHHLLKPSRPVFPVSLNAQEHKQSHTIFSYDSAIHYLGIAFRVLGIALLLSVLLPGGHSANSTFPQ